MSSRHRERGCSVTAEFVIVNREDIKRVWRNSEMLYIVGRGVAVRYVGDLSYYRLMFW